VDSLYFTNRTRGQDMTRTFYSSLAVKQGKKARDQQNMLHEQFLVMGKITPVMSEAARAKRAPLLTERGNERVSMPHHRHRSPSKAVASTKADSFPYPPPMPKTALTRPSLVGLFALSYSNRLSPHTEPLACCPPSWQHQQRAYGYKKNWASQRAVGVTRGK
jgi:hypothetical protein